MKEPREKNGHLVLVPCPLQGHMNPMLYLAKILHFHGFLITIIQTHPNSPIPSHHPDFSFESIDGLANYNFFAFNDVVAFLLALNTECKRPFHACLSRMQIDSKQGPISCIIYDAVMYFTAEVADDMKIPRIVLRTSSATNFYGLSVLPKQKGLLAIQDQQLEEPLKEIPFLRAKDMPVFRTSQQEAIDKVFGPIGDGTRTASAIIWNSLSCLEQTIFDKITPHILGPMFPVGPLHKHSNVAVSHFLSEEQSCISWLDTQNPNSVIYVSCGSLIKIRENELVEMAWGLAGSGQPFLWVVRPGLVNGSNGLEHLPKEFENIAKTRGKIIGWAPQKQVLAHQSVGAFWTHNGWNSTIESISEGVPMLCWPRVGDQKVNARLVSHFWRVGIQLEDELERKNIEECIKRLMAGEEGNEITRRAMQLKEKIEFSTREGGSSSEFISKLVAFIKLT